MLIKAKELSQIYFLPILSGILLALTLPPWGIEPLIWVALIPFFFFLNQNLSRRQLIIGAGLAGLIYILWLLWPLTSLNSWWIRNPDPNGFLWSNKESLLKVFIFLFSVYSGSFFFILFGLFYRKFFQKTLIGAVFIAFFWVFLEFLREFVVFGFTWGELGYALHDNLPLIQIASFGGVYSLSFLIVFINILLYFWIITWLKKGSYLKNASNKYLFLAILVILMAYSQGFYLLNNEEMLSNPKKVAVIHSTLKTPETLGLEAHNLYIETVEKALKTRPEFILLPENALPWLQIDEETGKLRGNPGENHSVALIFNKILVLSAKNPETTFLIGLHTRKNRENFNSIVSFEAGKVSHAYNKRNTLPIFENIPQFLEKSHVEPLDRAKGAENTIKTESGIEIAGLICSEIAMPRLANTKDSDFIINASNDSVFDSEIVGKQNHIMAKFRAVENRKYLLRSVKGGTSSIIDPFGRVIEKSNNEKMQILMAEIYL